MCAVMVVHTERPSLTEAAWLRAGHQFKIQEKCYLKKYDGDVRG